MILGQPPHPFYFYFNTEIKNRLIIIFYYIILLLMNRSTECHLTEQSDKHKCRFITQIYHMASEDVRMFSYNLLDYILTAHCIFFYIWIKKNVNVNLKKINKKSQ